MPRRGIRLRLIQAVLAGTRTTAELGALPGLGTTGQLYHHLRQLSAAGWLRTAGRGRYEVPAERVVALLVTVAAAGGAHSPSMRETETGSTDRPPITSGVNVPFSPPSSSSRCSVAGRRVV